MATATSIAQRVERGAAWLDQQLPGWHDLVNLDELRMSDACRCVLGQTGDRLLAHLGVTPTTRTGKVVEATYWEVLHFLPDTPWESDLDPEAAAWAADHGFSIVAALCAEENTGVWGQLSETWADQIRARRESTPEVDA